MMLVDSLTSLRGSVCESPASPLTSTCNSVFSPRLRPVFGADNLIPMLRKGHSAVAPLSVTSIFVGPAAVLVSSTIIFLGDSATGDVVVPPIFTASSGVKRPLQGHLI